MQVGFRRALQLHTAGRLDAAAAAYRSILRRHPEACDCWCNLGAALRALGRHDDALDVLRQGARVCPDHVGLNHNLGNALARTGDVVGALERYRAVLARDPEHLGAAESSGKILCRLERYDEAVDHFRTALQRHPDNASLYRILASALSKLRQLQAAAAAYRRAVALAPDSPDLRVAMYWGALRELGCYAEAERELRAAAARDAGSPDVLVALGDAQVSQGHLEAGMETCLAALAVDPDDYRARFQLARANFLAGRYAEAWPHYAWRRRFETWRKPRVFGRTWKGQPLGGQSILLYGEQGLGDVIQFVRYAPLIAQRGAEVFLYCPPSLVGLLRRLPDVRVVPNDRPCPRTNWACSLMDVPGVWGTDVGSIPGACAYLPARARARPLLPPTRQLRVGIVWAGKPSYGMDQQRSCRLDHFAPLVELPGTEFVSFQVGPQAQELRTSGWSGLIRETGAELVPFEATADALAEVDLVITVDTAMAHLAGAVGRPVWTLLGYAPDWRWMLGRRDTPWYPTMRLFRQPAPNDWDSVFREVRRALAALLVKSGRGAQST